MRIQFKAKTMRQYKGHDGAEGTVELTKAGDEAEVSEAVGKILCQRFRQDFAEVQPAEKPEHAPESDKLFRKTAKTKTK